MGFPGGAVVKNLLASQETQETDAHSIPGLGRSPELGNGNLLQYSWKYWSLESSVDRGACRLQSMGSQRVRHDWAPKHYMHIHVYCCWVAKSCLILWNPLDCSMPGFSVLHYLLEFAQTHVHWDGDAIQPSHLLLPPSPPALNLSQHHGLFQWVSSSHQVAKVLELQLQHQYECICRNTLFI